MQNGAGFGALIDALVPESLSVRLSFGTMRTRLYSTLSLIEFSGRHAAQVTDTDRQSGLASFE
jgi:hypothetical protein